MELPLNMNAEFIDSQYRLWKQDPHQVPRDWQIFFEGFRLASLPEAATAEVCDKAQVLRQSRVEELIYRYRDLGHLLACLDPLTACPTEHPLLQLEAFQLAEADLDRSFYTRHFADVGEATLRHILQSLKETYCRSIGVEYLHLQDPAERSWLQQRMEPNRNRPNVDAKAQLRILNKLYQATLFEEFLNSKYIGQKRFSIEGAEVVVAMLDALVEHAAERDCREIILGMAHRGRLTVQVSILQKPYEAVFCEFEDNYNPEALVGSGDVKYHQGYLAEIGTAGGRTVRMRLVDNPSHLESVDPVVEGVARARQEQAGEAGHQRVLPVLIHGDAGFSGQGVVFETLNLSQLEGYQTGGTIHLVINNQIGFTTLPEDARSTRYTTDVAKMLMVPIFHVHGEDPEAAVHVMQLANDYRLRFGKDVVVDVICYRRYGHNEGDEPYYTQPQMYERIKDRPPLYEIYGEKLLQGRVVSEDRRQTIKEEINQSLTGAFEAAREKTCAPPQQHFYENGQKESGKDSYEPVDTAVEKNTLLSLAERLQRVPEGFEVHRKLDRILGRRFERIEKGEGIDWATAEMLAFASLLEEGVPVRLSGQDSRRGTFSQRHSTLVDVRSGSHFVPLNALGENQAPFWGYDSMLSEYAVLGFEYGYSLASPHSLVLWEAQFGDFANNAQSIIDLYIAAGESKWQVQSGLVLLLPHAYEGQGSEHSSARLERYLQLCADSNMQVCNATTPAQYFHLLRRQVRRDFRKPLVIMTPKSLLRHPRAVSTLADMTSGYFQEVLDDSAELQPPDRVLLCSGKVYYDLLERREKANPSATAIVRLEQFYPFPRRQLERIIAGYPQKAQWCWVQEEPMNMGGWEFVQPLLNAVLGRKIDYIGRPAAATPATGHFKVHKLEQSAILDRAIGPLEEKQ